MKKMIVASILLSLFMGGVVYSSYQVVDVYICEEGMVLAEITAKSIVSRKELYRASYCDCQGVNDDMKSRVKKGSWEREGFKYEYGSCESPKNRVFRCVCVGTDRY
jgi:hypothetical protein